MKIFNAILDFLISSSFFLLFACYFMITKDHQTAFWFMGIGIYIRIGEAEKEIKKEIVREQLKGIQLKIEDMVEY